MRSGRQVVLYDRFGSPGVASKAPQGGLHRARLAREEATVDMVKGFLQAGSVLLRVPERGFGNLLHCQVRIAQRQVSSNDTSEIEVEVATVVLLVDDCLGSLGRDATFLAHPLYEAFGASDTELLEGSPHLLLVLTQTQGNLATRTDGCGYLLDARSTALADDLLNPLKTTGLQLCLDRVMDMGGVGVHHVSLVALLTTDDLLNGVL